MTATSTPVLSRTLGAYLESLASSDPAPGGGSVAALVGAFASGLGQMVVSLTRDAPDQLTTAARGLQNASSNLLRGAAKDEQAYTGYVEASRLPRDSPKASTARQRAMEDALINAAQVPLDTAAVACDLLTELKPITSLGNKHVISDADIAISLALVAVQAALVNVRVNIPLIKDNDESARISARAQEIEELAADRASQCRTELALRRD